MIEGSVVRRARRGLALWRSQGAEIRPMPAGGLSVPSCSQPGRSYRVSLVGEGRCGCADWRRRKQPCKHLYAALVWAAKRRAALASGRREGGGMTAATPTPAGRYEIHHRIPRCLLKAWDRGNGPGLGPEDLQAWCEWFEEAHRYGVNPDVSREELAALIEGSAVEIAGDAHRAAHSEADDFARWGRLGGLETLGRYGRPWFALLARRRWKKIGADALGAYRAELAAKAGTA
ncbi:MAG: SWIM zinc finger family protein [Actinomycetota bacterium]